MSSIVFRWKSVKAAIVAAADEILSAYKAACGEIQKECGQNPHPILYFTASGIKFFPEAPKSAYLEIINNHIGIRHTDGYGDIGPANTHWHGSLKSWEKLADFVTKFHPESIREVIEECMEKAADRD